MRAVIQRVSEASVAVDQKIEGEIAEGLLIFLGIVPEDTSEDLEWLSKKIVNLRIFDDNRGVMNLSLKEQNGAALVISQFTLHAQTKKGNRPSYIKAARPDIAIPLYQQFIMQLENDLGKEIQTGIFGANMQVSLLNDGPVTLIIDSKNRE
ncbi:MAG TPA: D-tyrosyl-tRNA(Tyr) deacylase [Flavobacteriaceae bacterium]|jgi:D-tyrosyl-tRNA(Tyr) deacylase|nr:D-tyrosyl-tRNA(Tyr) deacylase [Formosa sp.]HCL07482.1 D-tyrosyl-tRNA(Tyr) deacylase [Flavobacteriaceae bacterium]|tara:strand:+ start:506 stop:958 length:453 start_codon:yes stop_codon:yes gene_type:complete